MENIFRVHNKIKIGALIEERESMVHSPQTTVKKVLDEHNKIKIAALIRLEALRQAQGDRGEKKNVEQLNDE